VLSSLPHLNTGAGIMDSPIIYNLFPRLVGPMDQWIPHAQRAKTMGFDWIYINPVQYPGFSGSLYAVKDLYKLNPLFIPAGDEEDPMAALRRTISALHDMGLKVMMDLVINHTAKDSPLIKEHPAWFRRDKQGDVLSPSAIDPADARKVTVWGDLAEVDNAHSTERQSLWTYWSAMIQFYLDVGFDGFRCDAAYKVPAELWELLIGVARRNNPAALFAAETLGCRLTEVRALQDTGFDYLFNSSKWWNFDAPWCLQQHEEFGEIAPSIAFPESHDTPRLMLETGGLAQVQRMRYAFTACFSAGQLMPVGYEYGFTRKLDVCTTTPDDWEETGVDISAFVGEVNRLKRQIPALGVEGRLVALSSMDTPSLVLRKTAATSAGTAQIYVVINKDWQQPQPCKLPPELLEDAPKRLHRICRSAEAVPWPKDDTLQLDPAEVVLLY
jgi:starch synthase (maltosyl-transferring)